MPRILAITPYPSLSADTRYRFTQFLPKLEQAGWQVSLQPFMDEALFAMYNQPGRLPEKVIRTLRATLRRVVVLPYAGKFDIIFLHKEAFPFGPPWMERILHNQTRVVYDLDDAFWTHPPQFKQIGARFRDPRRIEKMLAMCDHILAGNSFLAEHAQLYNTHVTIFPTVVDTERFYLRDEHADDAITVGWIGRWSSSDYLEMLIPVFQRLVDRFPQVRLHFVGAKGMPLPAGIPIEIIPWRLESEVEEIARFDIGIMPLPDDVYSRGKCGLKLLQYMSMGVPGVASPVGVNREIIQDGNNGFWASNEGEWFEKLSCLICDEALRKTLGLAGRRTVEDKYSLQVAAADFVHILDQVLRK
jgi:glycosyltransferase involved in cell wall biosynthesis